MAESGTKSGGADITIKANGTYSSTKRARVNKGSKFKVRVENDSLAVVTVGISGFRNSNGESKLPLERNPYVTVAPGERDKMSSRVRASADSDVYTYNITVDGTVIADPELEIP
jgi:hypothetical protein